MNIQIRRAGQKELPQWVSMRKQLWPHASFDELKEIEHLFKADNFACFLAESDASVVGFIELALRPYVNGCSTSPVAFIEGIWVNDKLQKQGIGRLLVKKAEEWASSLSLKELASDTRIESEHSIHAHKSWGFQETERIVYFKKDL